MVEAVVEKTVVNKAVKAGFFARKVQWVGRRNAPDYLFSSVARGTVFIEFKRAGAKPNTMQLREHAEMRKAGIEVRVCDNIRDGLRILGISE